MKKTGLLLAALFLLGANCGPKLDDKAGTAILQDVIAAGKKSGKSCSAALLSKELQEKVLKEKSISVSSYASWLQTDAGKKAMKSTITDCMKK